MTVDLDQLVQTLSPIVSAQVTASIQAAQDTTRTPVVASGTVVAILSSPDNDTVMVEMDDGGMEDDPAHGVIPALRMRSVAVGDRVRVHFWPAAGAEAHQVNV